MLELSQTTVQKRDNGLKIILKTGDFKRISIPGFGKRAKLSECFIRVTDLPTVLDKYMKVNPRIPKRTTKGRLSGPVVTAIQDTLMNHPEEMVLKNQGIFLLVDKAFFRDGSLSLRLSDDKRHGIVNGGHTYVAIQDLLDELKADEDTEALHRLKNAYVRLHIYEGIPGEQVAEIAQGLNRSKQVDDPSLANLQGEFDIIKKSLNGVPGSESIAYHQGSAGGTYISEVLVCMEFFNTRRFNENKHPNQLYRKQSMAMKYFEQDKKSTPKLTEKLISRIPDIMKLRDLIKKNVPIASKAIGFEFGRMKVSSRSRAKMDKAISLPFIQDTTDYRIPNGWVYPMLAAFRANVNKDTLEWIVPPEELLQDVIKDLVSVCILAHRDSGLRPEMVGYRESVYRQCYDKVLLGLAKRGIVS